MKELFEIDKLQQYFGYGLKICDGLEIKQPTVGDIVRMGEDNYYDLIYTLTAIPSDMIAQLDKMHIDWEEIEDFELFCLLVPNLELEKTQVMFGDLDFSLFRIEVPVEGERRCQLRHLEKDIIIDELRYKAIVNYLCGMFGIKKQPRHAGNAFAKKMMIEMAYEDLEKNKRKRERDHKSQLQPLISTMINMPGFKYNLKEVMEIGYAEFIDSVTRTQIISSTTALLNGVYSGNVDTKKIDKSLYNYMREIK